MAIEHGVVPPIGRTHPDVLHRPGLHGAIEGEEEDHGHHEKKPVLKKVKEKVKKIKDTIKKKHGHDHDGAHDDHDVHEHEQDTSDEEDGYEEEDANEEERADDREVHGGTMVAEHDTGSGGPPATSANEHIRDHWEKVPLRDVMNIGGLEEDPGAPKSATSGHLRAGEEVGDSPVIRSFEAMAISEHPSASSAEKSTEHKEHNAAAGEEHEQTQSYAEKLSSATKATAATVYEKVAQAGATVKEKVQGAATAGTGGDGAQSYTEKISSTAKDAASTVYSKVAEAGTAVMEKVQGPPTPEGVDASTTKQPGKGSTGYLTEKLKPGEEDRALSQVISDTLRMRREKVPEDVPVAPAATESSVGDSGRGAGVMGTIRGAVTSLFGGGRGPRSSPASETERKVVEEAKRGDDKPVEGRTQVQEMELDRGTGGLI